MILIRRIATVVSVLIIGGLFELLIWRTHWYVSIIIALVLIILGLILWLTRKRISIQEKWPLLVTPILFMASGFMFLFFVEKVLVKQISIVAFMFLWWVFMENMFLFLYQPVRYQAYALENITAYLNLATVFLVGASFNSLILFLGYSDWMLLLLMFAILLILILQTYSINKISIRENYASIVILAILTAEIFWVSRFFPTSYLVNGLFIAIVFYFSTGIVRHLFLESLDKHIVKRYLWISLSVLLLVVTTARWT